MHLIKFAPKNIQVKNETGETLKLKAAKIKDYLHDALFEDNSQIEIS